MTTKEAAMLYEAQHVARWAGKGYVVYNPHGKPIEELPVIYGFNNGGEPGWYRAELIADDGEHMGGHLCSSEAYMRSDLGILEDSAPYRHEGFRKKYPDGYRMDFLPYDAPEILAAMKLNKERFGPKQG